MLIPNQHIGAWQTGFAPQWVTREYLARRGQAPFNPSDLKTSRCPLLGYHRETIQVEGQTVGTWFFDVSAQPEVGEEAYDQGALILTGFFHEQIRQFLHPDLSAKGRQIIEACLAGATAEDYNMLLEN